MSEEQRRPTCLFINKKLNFWNTEENFGKIKVVFFVHFQTFFFLISEVKSLKRWKMNKKGWKRLKKSISTSLIHNTCFASLFLFCDKILLDMDPFNRISYLHPRAIIWWFFDDLSWVDYIAQGYWLVTTDYKFSKLAHRSVLFDHKIILGPLCKQSTR